MASSRKKSSPDFSARAKRDLRPHPPTAGSHGRDASLPPARRKKAAKSAPTNPTSSGARPAPGEPAWFGPQPRGRRKVARPFVANRPLEARLSASRARGPWRLDRPANRAAIRRILAREAARSGVRVDRVAIEATTLRLELAAPRRQALSCFFRAVAGRIPRVVTGSERGRPLAGRAASERRFWDGLVATRAL